jgi:hypothetical protein
VSGTLYQVKSIFLESLTVKLELNYVTCLLLLFNAITPPIIPSMDPNMARPIPVRPNTEKINTTIPHMVASCDLLLIMIAPMISIIPEMSGISGTNAKNDPVPTRPGSN